MGNKKEKQKEEKDVCISFWVDADMAERFDRVCEDNSLNRSELLRKHVRRFLEEWERERVD